MRNVGNIFKNKHEILLQRKNERNVSFKHKTSDPYKDNSFDSSRDHLYLIIPTNPKTNKTR